MKKTIWIAFLGAVILAGCSGDGAPGSWKEHNLLAYDLPVRIMGPDSVKVTSTDMLSHRDVTVEGVLEDGYGVQIYSSSATSQDATKIKSEELAATKEHRFFKELIQDDEQGFIYTTEIDSVNIYHQFKYIKVQGSKEYLFQSLSGRKYDLDQVKKMYKSVQPKPQ